tara:strand:- start:1272 stop:1808 length:537 start_codon:yes stop_codon:yes gene_type:complete
MKLHTLEQYNKITEAVRYHVDNDLSLTESIFRIGSEGYAGFACEVRELYYQGVLELSENDLFIVEKLNTGKKAIFQKRGESDKKVILDSPERLPKGERKKFRVYRDSGKKTSDGEIIAFEIKWGDPKRTVKNHDEGARKSFLARHKCSEKKDMDKAGWWACNVHLFWKQLGLESDKPW